MLLYCRELLFNKKPMGALYIYPIFLNLTIECGQTNLEQPGSLCLVAMRMVKHLDDVVALHTLQVKGVIGSRGCVARKHVYGQVMTGNFAFAYDESMLDGIHHLTHIARPRIGKEDVFGIGGERRSGTTYLPGI